MTKEQILLFLQAHIHAVVSTCGSNNQPESAIVGFGQTDRLEIFFGTFKTSRKYKNLLANNKVSFVIGGDTEYITVQYEGIATELTKEETEPLLVMFHEKIPSAAIYHTFPEQVYFKVTPRWIRYSDLSETEDKIQEFTFPK